MFRHPNFALGGGAVFTLGFAVYSVNLPIMLYLQEAQGLSAELSGLMLLPMRVDSVVMSPIIGRLTDRVSPGRISRIGFTALITAMALFGVFMHLDVGPGWLLVPVVALGFANSLCWAPNSTISLRDLPPALVGAGSGVYNTSRQVGAVVGSAALGATMQTGVSRAVDTGVGVVGFGAAMGNALLVPVVPLVAGLLAVSRFRADGRPPAARAGAR
ncbi:MFS transporter [Citricoccus nitrophenolicus]|uniref:MFS transporter n=1 Tax=Citricoccus nitrophenolicus TaxID=863575 RepID=UPI0031E5E94A